MGRVAGASCSEGHADIRRGSLEGTVAEAQNLARDHGKPNWMSLFESVFSEGFPF